MTVVLTRSAGLSSVRRARRSPPSRRGSAEQQSPVGNAFFLQGNHLLNSITLFLPRLLAKRIRLAAEAAGKKAAATPRMLCLQQAVTILSRFGDPRVSDERFEAQVLHRVTSGAALTRDCSGGALPRLAVISSSAQSASSHGSCGAGPSSPPDSSAIWDGSLGVRGYDSRLVNRLHRFCQ
jgi:hypothetical protein